MSDVKPNENEQPQDAAQPQTQKGVERAESPQDAPKVLKRGKGRPRAFETVEALKTALDDYFQQCDNGEMVEAVNRKGEVVEIRRKIPYTVMGLCRVLEISRDTLLEYGKGVYDDDVDFGGDYSDTIKKAKMRIAEATEINLQIGNATGAIFSLKNNWDWKDKTEVDQNLGGSIGITTEVVSYADAVDPE